LTTGKLVECVMWVYKIFRKLLDQLNSEKLKKYMKKQWK
jgi:hypothetical protein